VVKSLYVHYQWKSNYFVISLYFYKTAMAAVAMDIQPISGHCSFCKAK